MTTVYIIRENSSPCAGVTFAAFSTLEKAKAFVSALELEDNQLWIESCVLDSADIEVCKKAAFNLD